MIVRVMGHGQWVFEPDELLSLNEADVAVEDAVKQGDEKALRTALENLLQAVKEKGVPVPDDVLAESDLVLPDVDAGLEEVQLLLDSTSEYYGLIPDQEPEEQA